MCTGLPTLRGMGPPGCVLCDRDLGAILAASSHTWAQGWPLGTGCIESALLVTCLLLAAFVSGT